MKSYNSSTIYLGSDHRGFVMKEVLEQFLKKEGYVVVDRGNTILMGGDDYPDFAVAVGRSVVQDPGSRGILLCGSGVGVCVAANKVSGVRAAMAWNEESAVSGKKDDDTNVLCLGVQALATEEAQKIVLAWLRTEFQSEERFVRRLKKIQYYERAEAVRVTSNLSKTTIVPAILEEQVESAYAKLSRVEGLSEWVQIDVMDGVFVPERSFSLETFDIKRYPFRYEAHLMVSDPMAYVELCARVGISRCVFHWESVGEKVKAQELCEYIAEKGMQVGVALNPETENAVILSLIPFIDALLFLGVHPGKSGQKIIPDVIERISDVREVFPRRISIGIDGGVTEENFAQCVSAGANRIVMNSALFRTENISEVFERLGAV